MKSCCSSKKPRGQLNALLWHHSLYAKRHGNLFGMIAIIPFLFLVTMFVLPKTVFHDVSELRWMNVTESHAFRLDKLYTKGRRVVYSPDNEESSSLMEIFARKMKNVTGEEVQLIFRTDSDSVIKYIKEELAQFRNRGRSKTFESMFLPGVAFSKLGRQNVTYELMHQMRKRSRNVDQKTDGIVYPVDTSGDVVKTALVMQHVIDLAIMDWSKLSPSAANNESSSSTTHQQQASSTTPYSTKLHSSFSSTTTPKANNKSSTLKPNSSSKNMSENSRSKDKSRKRRESFFLTMNFKLQRWDSAKDTLTVRNIGTGCYFYEMNSLSDHLLPLGAFLSVILPMLTLIDLMILEKKTQLREYLLICGVPSWKIKLSWLLFFAPIVIVSSLLSAFGYKLVGVYEKLDLWIVIINNFLFALAMLSFGLFLSAIFTEASASAVLFIGWTILCIMIYYALLGIDPALPINGFRANILRVTSFFSPILPHRHLHRYIQSYRVIKMGLTFDLLFAKVNSSVSAKDDTRPYEISIWYFQQIFVYLFLAWYWEHVRPGDYGHPKPFYFPFQPSFWTSNYGMKPVPGEDKKDPGVPAEPDSEKKTTHLSGVESVTVGGERVPAIVLSHVSKQYPDRQVRSVNNLSLTFFKDEVTAFLGENGAGKSTTMNMIVGMVPQTSGTITVLGLDVHKDISTIRKVMGFVPQYDVLFPDISVEEHILFFGWLKGLSKSEQQVYVAPLLEKLDLVNQLKTMVTQLSGGQKRKLLLLTAYMGGPKVVVLDEPTSGVDPFSRRSIWNVITSNSRGIATILSTHFMQEADLLGDRISVVSVGRLRCSGSPMFLKAKYGKGYRITAAMLPSHQSSYDKDRVVSFFESECEGSTLNSDQGQDLTFTVPMNIEILIPFLKSLESQKNPLKLASYGFNQPTIEEVFFATIHSDISGTPATDLRASRRGTEYPPLSTEVYKDVCINVVFRQLGSLILRKIRSISSSLLEVMIISVTMICLIFNKNGYRFYFVIW